MEKIPSSSRIKTDAEKIVPGSADDSNFEADSGLITEALSDVEYKNETTQKSIEGFTTTILGLIGKSPRAVQLFKAVFMSAVLAQPGCSMITQAYMGGLSRDPDAESLDPFRYMSEAELQEKAPSLYRLMEAAKDGIADYNGEPVEGYKDRLPSYVVELAEEIKALAELDVEWSWSMELREGKWYPAVLNELGPMGGVSAYPNKEAQADSLSRATEIHTFHNHNSKVVANAGKMDSFSGHIQGVVMDDEILSKGILPTPSVSDLTTLVADRQNFSNYQFVTNLGLSDAKRKEVNFVTTDYGVYRYNLNENYGRNENVDDVINIQQDEEKFKAENISLYLEAAAEVIKAEGVDINAFDLPYYLQGQVLFEMKAKLCAYTGGSVNKVEACEDYAHKHAQIERIRSQLIGLEVSGDPLTAEEKTEYVQKMYGLQEKYIELAGELGYEVKYFPFDSMGSGGADQDTKFKSND